MKKLVLVTVGLLLCCYNISVYAASSDATETTGTVSTEYATDSDPEHVPDKDATYIYAYVEYQVNDTSETDDNMFDNLSPTPYYPTEVVIAATKAGYSMPGIIISLPYDVYEEEPSKVSPPMAEHLTKQSGVFYGPSGKETYYNLPMGRVISYMRDLGYTAEEYPYWVRADGAKMLGDYVMVAADLSVYSKGSIVPTSLGTGIVCDTGAFAGGSVALDIAVTW